MKKETANFRSIEKTDEKIEKRNSADYTKIGTLLIDKEFKIGDYYSKNHQVKPSNDSNELKQNI